MIAATRTQPTPNATPTTAPVLIAPSPYARVIQLETQIERTGQNLDRVCDVLDDYPLELSEPIRQTLEIDAANLERTLAGLYVQKAEALADYAAEMAALARALRPVRSH